MKIDIIDLKNLAYDEDIAEDELILSAISQQGDKCFIMDLGIIRWEVK